MKGNKQKNPIVVGIIPKGDAVVMVRRANPEEGEGGVRLELVFPGGVLRVGESREACVKREVREETGYEVEPVRLISYRMQPEMRRIIFYYLCRLVHPEPVTNPSEPYEIAEVLLVPIKKLQSLIKTSIDPLVLKELGLG